MTLNDRMLKAVYEEAVYNAFNFIKGAADTDVRKVSAPLHMLSSLEGEAREATGQYFALLLTVKAEKQALTRQLQMALNEHLGELWNVDLAVDGVIGPATADAFTGYTTEAMVEVFKQLSKYLLDVIGPGQRA
ncbi:hypothetical protein [Pseudomonas sp. Teo4]|uniref:hypothetical protein n=1 Tax=Pseudomonas sp. Teo4 TaxID=3064528 RepID=UPI002ABAD0A8|nr:hypothetical protein [Pseudomonas sp. Teo4]MDZ3993925.1 hypothetical protein [Pseudomonas sp. Teo4]